MKIKIILLILLIELVLLFPLLLFNDFFQVGFLNSLLIKYALRNSLELYVLRLIFYGIIQIVLLNYMISKQFKIIYVMFINLAQYIVISFVYSMILTFTADYFNRDFFYDNCVLLFFSPLIAYKIVNPNRDTK